jgi:hypothetical protein
MAVAFEVLQESAADLAALHLDVALSKTNEPTHGRLDGPEF